MVLIVNRDLGFVFWLGQLLAQSGCGSIPARNVRQAKLLLRQLDIRIDALVIDPMLGGAAGLQKSLMRANPRTHIVEVLRASRFLPVTHGCMTDRATPEAAESWRQMSQQFTASVATASRV